VFTFSVLKQYNVFGINNTGMVVFKESTLELMFEEQPHRRMAAAGSARKADTTAADTGSSDGRPSDEHPLL
jgi:hypothetical protein